MFGDGVLAKGSKKRPTSELPTQKRSCTDVLCALIFIVFIIATIVASIYGYIYGDLRNLFQPYDGQGTQCGKGNATNYPYLYWANIGLSYESFTEGTVCVKECPPTNTSTLLCFPNKDIPR